MTNPVVKASNAFLAIFNNLPVSFKSLLSLVLILFVVTAFIDLLWHLR